MSDFRSITKFWDAAPLVGDIPDDAKILIGMGNKVYRVTKAELEAQMGGGSPAPEPEPAAYVDPESVDFAEDLVASLVAAGLMAAAD